MHDIHFTVPGEPQGKARPRVVRTKNGNSRTYTPDKTVAYEELVRQRWVALHTRPFIGAVTADIVAYYGIPKSAGKAKRRQMLTGDICPTKKPDCDNIAKIILDALNGFAYHDDSQVVEVRIRKYYADIPRVDVGLRGYEYEQ